MLKSRISQNIHCKSCHVNFLCLPLGLNADETESINHLISNIKMVSRKEHVFCAYTAMQNIYAVYQGSCKEYWIDDNGSECVTHFYLPGDIVGLESISSKKHLFYVSALEDSQLCVIPVEPLFKLMQQHEDILKRFVRLMSFKIQNDQRMRIGSTAYEQVCRFLLDIIYRRLERNPLEKDIHLSMSQLEISSFLGVAYETVNRIFKKLKLKKIVRIKRGVINILDLVQLESLAR